MTSHSRVQKSAAKMHVGVLYIGRKGGICHYTYELVRVISKMTRVTCYVSANNALLDEWRSLPCSVKVFQTYNGFPSLVWSMLSPQGALRVAREIDADAPDILLDTGSGPWQGIIKKEIHCKSLLANIIHDVQFHPDRWNKLLQLYDLVYPTKGDIFIGLSEYSYKKILRRFPGAMYIQSRHGVIHQPSKIDLDKIDKIAKNRNKILFFGRIEKYKGIQVLIDAFRIAKQSNSQLSLAIVGNGPLDDNTKSQISQLKIQLINKWISDDDLMQIVAEHGVMVMPYLSATQSGVAAVAIANGLPCIGTNVGALPEQIIHGRNGLIVPPGDAQALASAMLNISSNYSLACKMSEEAYLLAATVYSWEQIGSELIDKLESFVCNPNQDTAVR